MIHRGGLTVQRSKAKKEVVSPCSAQLGTAREQPITSSAGAIGRRSLPSSELVEEGEKGFMRRWSALPRPFPCHPCCSVRHSRRILYGSNEVLKSFSLLPARIWKRNSHC